MLGRRAIRVGFKPVLLIGGDVFFKPVLLIDGCCFKSVLLIGGWFFGPVLPVGGCCYNPVRQCPRRNRQCPRSTKEWEFKSRKIDSFRGLRFEGLGCNVGTWLRNLGPLLGFVEFPPCALLRREVAAPLLVIMENSSSATMAWLRTESKSWPSIAWVHNNTRICLKGRSVSAETQGVVE